MYKYCICTISQYILLIRIYKLKNNIYQYNLWTYIIIEQEKLSRWSLYRILEKALQTLGSGKACLLRVVCEAAETPFKEGHGLLGEVVHVVLTPSTTSEEYEMYADREYHAAELIGQKANGMCKSLYPECPYSPLDYFTEKVDFSKLKNTLNL